MTYGEKCDWYFCNPSQGLTCSSGYGAGCFCPNNYGGSVCDCITSQYWTGSVCTTRVGFGSFCSADYMCLYNTGLTCVSSQCTCALANTYWTGTQCRN